MRYATSSPFPELILRKCQLNWRSDARSLAGNHWQGLSRLAQIRRHLLALSLQWVLCSLHARSSLAPAPDFTSLIQLPGSI
jgi:hypothetical protein